MASVGAERTGLRNRSRHQKDQVVHPARTFQSSSKASFSRCRRSTINKGTIKGKTDGKGSKTTARASSRHFELSGPSSMEDVKIGSKLRSARPMGLCCTKKPVYLEQDGTTTLYVKVVPQTIGGVVKRATNQLHYKHVRQKSI